MHMSCGAAGVGSGTNATHLSSLEPDLRKSGVLLMHGLAEPESIVVAPPDVRWVWATRAAALCDERVTMAVTRARAAIGAVPAVIHEVGGTLKRADGADEA